MMLLLTGLALAELIELDADEPEPIEAELLIVHARLWDGTGAAAVGDGWVAVRDGRILAVGSGEDSPEAERTVDAGGQTLIPGLIDAHVHLEAVPGAALRGDDAEQLRAARRAGLRAYPACGVTTVLDTGISFATLAEIRGWLEAGEVGPRLLTLGPVLGPRDGYVEAFLPQHPGLDSIGEIRDRLDQLVAIDAVGVKLTIEEGYILPVLPMHSPQLRAEIVAEATARGLPVFAHAQDSEAQGLAMDAGVYAILHMSRDDDPALAPRLAASGTWLVTTLSIDAAPLQHFEPDPWSDPLSRLVVPDEQRQTALSASGWRDFKRGMAAVALPGWRPWITGLASRLKSVRRYLRRSLSQTMENTRRAKAAGVPLVVGSDAGAYDTIPFYFHGLSTLSEIALVHQAGLSPAEALQAATGLSAELLGLAGEIGTITPGAAADMVLLAADPLVDPLALREIVWTMQGGVVRAPAEWLHPPAP